MVLDIDLFFPLVLTMNVIEKSCTVRFNLSVLFLLFLLVPPHIMPFEIEESVFYGESVQMTCHASKGDRPMSIFWTFGGQDLSTVSGIKTLKIAEQTSILTIASVTGAHSGNYTCIAKNKAGEHRYSTPLHVNGILVKCQMSQHVLYI